MSIIIKPATPPYREELVSVLVLVADGANLADHVALRRAARVRHLHHLHLLRDARHAVASAQPQRRSPPTPPTEACGEGPLTWAPMASLFVGQSLGSMSRYCVTDSSTDV